MCVYRDSEEMLVYLLLLANALAYANAGCIDLLYSKIEKYTCQISKHTCTVLLSLESSQKMAS